MKPLAIDLCCGLGGWSDGLLAEGWEVVGFDIERHKYGEHQYPAQLVIQDVLTLTGEQFRGRASLIVASPPCQKYSYMAMPWSRAKKLRDWYRDPQHPERLVDLNALFDACMRIGKEADCPIIVENVRGAQPWVGRARWSFGSFMLWGDVPALMPPAMRAAKVPGLDWNDRTRKGQAFNPAAQGRAFREELAIKNGGGSWFNIAHNTTSGKGNNPDGRKQPGIKISEIGFNVANAHEFGHMVEGVKIKRSERDKHDHIGVKRKFASAMIAKIPLPLSRWVAKAFFPPQTEVIAA